MKRPRIWEAPGYTFQLLDESGAVAFPPGFESRVVPLTASEIATRERTAKASARLDAEPELRRRLELTIKRS